MFRVAFGKLPSRALASSSRQALRYTHSAAPSLRSRTTTNRNAAVMAGITLAVGYAGWHATNNKVFYAEEAHPVQEVPETVSPLEEKEITNLTEQTEITHPSEDAPPAASDEEAAEGDAGSAAYNPETGEINWDCPCLGGMAHGPCGEQFREAFSCFIHSEKEPKGIDCVEKFKHMQDCFRAHPDVYGEELDDEEDDGAKGLSHSSETSEQEPEPEPEKPRRKVRSAYSDDD